MPRLSEHWRSVAPELRLCFVAFRIGIWMGVNWHRLAPTCLIMTVDLEPPLSAPSDVRGGGLREDTSASSEGPITKGRASPVTANLMCSRVLGARKWSRPGRVGAGLRCTVAWAARGTCRGGAGGLGCTAISEKLNKMRSKQVQSQHWDTTAMTIQVAPWPRATSRRCRRNAELSIAVHRLVLHRSAPPTGVAKRRDRQRT